MPDDARLPLLFLDVDGPLLPFGEDPVLGEDPMLGEDPVLGGWDDSLDSFLSRLSRGIGERLAALPCRLVWATAWEQDANVEIGPRIGLPPLPVVMWPELSDERMREDEWFGLHWKTRALVDWAAGRPFVWVDDELTDSDRRWVAERSPAPALLHHVESSRGLVDEDFDALGAWLRAVRGSGIQQ